MPWLPFLTSLLVLCLPLAGSAQVEASTAPETARRMLDAQYVGLELAAIGKRALSELEQQQGRVRSQDRDRLEGLVRLGFAPDTLYRHVQHELVATLEPEHAAVAAEWLALDHNRRLYLMGHGADRSCLAELDLEELAALATAERAALIVRVARGTRTAGRRVRRGSLVFTAMLVAGNHVMPMDRRMGDEQIRLLIEAQRAALAARHPTDLRALHCAFREVPTPDLASAAAFFASPAGRWLRAATDRAVERALVKAGKGTARYIVDAFGDAPPAAPLHTAMRTFLFRPL